MPYLSTNWTGARGLVYYGETILFVDEWKVDISMDLIDITNVGIYTVAGWPTGLPAKVNNLARPEGKKLNAKVDFPKNQSQYGASRVMQESNLRVAKITCSGLCAKPYKESDLIIDYFMPRIGNHVTMQFSNNETPNTTLFVFPDCIVNNVTFELNVRNYQRWTMEATTTQKYGPNEDGNQWETNWDIYPGDGVPFQD